MGIHWEPSLPLGLARLPHEKTNRSALRYVGGNEGKAQGGGTTPLQDRCLGGSMTLRYGTGEEQQYNLITGRGGDCTRFDCTRWGHPVQDNPPINLGGCLLAGRDR